jgi:hypothetical protein
MKLKSAQSVFKALIDAEVRFIVVGGLAVNVHGLMRMTLDIDLVVQLVPENIRRTFDALKSAGYRPTVPITAGDFGNAKKRKSWIKEKGMRVLRFYNDKHRETPVDLLVSEPFSFVGEYKRAVIRTLEGVGDIRIVSLPTLLRMKKIAGRAQDIADLDNLRLRLENSES